MAAKRGQIVDAQFERARVLVNRQQSPPNEGSVTVVIRHKNTPNHQKPNPERLRGISAARPMVLFSRVSRSSSIIQETEEFNIGTTILTSIDKVSSIFLIPP
uniref:Uncharacterized protein n=1 Tax=Coccidioides posadasii RMSCC 3488 TaxID=454284 RepID=A0A0J6I0K5_COCPO|nr:hypothetical protein CPAG_01138 [Coccidioides posadasii RMSCC 3488]